MEKLTNNWRLKTLEILENKSWGDSSGAPTSLAKRCIDLSKIAIVNFTLGDLRLMIGQKFGLRYLIPLAIEKLQDDIFVEAELYEGDLLENVLAVNTSYWDNNEDDWLQLKNLIKDKAQIVQEMGIDLTNFNNSKFSKKRGRYET